MLTHHRAPPDTSPRGLLRLYYRLVIVAVGMVLALQLFVRYGLGSTDVHLPPAKIALSGVIMLLAWFGLDLARYAGPSSTARGGYLLGILGLLLVVFCEENGGLGSAFYVLVLATCVFGALVLDTYRMVILTLWVVALYALGGWFFPRDGGLLDAGFTGLSGILAEGSRASGRDLADLVIQGSFLCMGSWIATRFATGFKERIVDLEHGATRDPLTGLPNRRGFVEKVRNEVKRALQFDWPIAILAMDLDHFKRVNDRFGHKIGDDVLVEAAKLMRDAAGPLDHLARLGGEEFAVAAVGADRNHGADLADRIVRSFRSHDWERVQPGLAITCSVGVAVVLPRRQGATQDLSELIDLADGALMQVKQNGRNGYMLADQVASALSEASATSAHWK